MARYSIKTKILAFFNRCGIRIYASPQADRSLPLGRFGGAVGFVGAFILLSLFSCSSDDDGGGRTSKVERQTVRLYLNIPSSDGTRVGDPGRPTGEGIAWDRLAVMIEYPDDVSGNENIPEADRHSVIYVDKTDYDAGIDAQGYYWVPLDLPEGKVRFYGVTYSKDEGAQLETEINAIGASDDATLSFAGLEISNDYATADGTMDVAKFLSVATGYYEENGSHDFTVEQKAEWEDEDMPRMTLTRLAAKIDIQWDAANAYPEYTDVKVENFTFYGDNASTDIASSGKGRLFPDLCTGQESKILGGKSFLSVFTSPISQRNGRVYHYVFPDGVSTPKIVFGLSANHVKDDNQTENINGNYTFNFTGGALKKASWYKINTTISGLSNINTSQDITFGDGSTQTTDTGE